MKTLLTYIVALALGFATALLFSSMPSSYPVFMSISSWLSELMCFIYLPVLLIVFSSGVSSLVKNRKGLKVALSMLLWTLGSTILLSLLGALFYLAHPISIPNSSTAGMSVSDLNSMIATYTNYSLRLLEPNSLFFTLSYASKFIFPVIVIAWIFGLSIKPSSDVIRPIYQVMNSLSEAMYRVSRFSLIFGSVFAYFASVSFFLDSYEEKSAIINRPFMLTLIASSLLIFFLVIPFLYAVYTGFKRNPYSVMFRSVSSYITALVSSNILSASLFSLSLVRGNMGVQKRVASVSIPTLSVFARGGTAFISTMTTLMVVHAITGSVSLPVAFAIAFSIALTSFVSSAALGGETLMASILALRLVGVNLLGRECVLVGLLPLINGIAIAIDSYIINLGAVDAGYWVGTNVSVSLKDTI